ncbi:MAG: hypothetical protein ACRDLP_12845 [Solirubrobacteraceae bacterium]
MRVCHATATQRMRLFSRQRDAGDEAPGEALAEELAGLEAQQALLLGALRRADGVRVGYAELRDEGIEFPAIVASELELAGVPIEHTGDGARLREPTRRAPAVAVAVSQTKPRPTGARRGVSVRWTAPIALLVAAVVTVIAVGSEGPGKPTVTVPPPAQRVHRPTVATAPPTSHARSPVHRHRAVPHRPPVPVSTLLATQLETHGHDLLDGGDYAAAVPVLRRAVAATGERLSRCLEPADTRCLTFAYALYDLGHALELEGDPRAAVPVLRERFEIDNQRSVVADQLAAARARAVGSSE